MRVNVSCIKANKKAEIRISNLHLINGSHKHPKYDIKPPIDFFDILKMTSNIFVSF